MKIFAYEFVTGGGMAGEAPPPGLVHEADAMLRALLAELGQLPGIELLTTRDPRLPPLPGVETLPASPGESPLAQFARGVAAADLVWPTAPETGRALEQLAHCVRQLGRGLLGSAPEAVRTAGSKWATARSLADAGVPVVATTRDAGSIPPERGAWAVKPDDGAGCDRMVRLPAAAAAARLARGAGMVAQPWLAGEPLSLSLLCAGGAARVLSLNRQRVAVAGDGTVELTGLEVNVLPERRPDYMELAGGVARAIPGLWGYVGVDLVRTAAGPVVLEVNPRLTTSYCGLGRALRLNLAALVVQMWRSGRLPDPPLSVGSPVSLTLEPARAG